MESVQILNNNREETQDERVARILAEAAMTRSKLGSTINSIEESMARAKKAEMDLEYTLGRIDKLDEDY